MPKLTENMRNASTLGVCNVLNSRASAVPSSSSRSVSPTARLPMHTHTVVPYRQNPQKLTKPTEFLITQSSAAFSTSNKSLSVADFKKIQQPKDKLQLVQEWVQDQKTCSSIDNKTGTVNKKLSSWRILKIERQVLASFGNRWSPRARRGSSQGAQLEQHFLWKIKRKMKSFLRKNSSF